VDEKRGWLKEKTAPQKWKRQGRRGVVGSTGEGKWEGKLRTGGK
jgi:hypothetical protein